MEPATVDETPIIRVDSGVPAQLTVDRDEVAGGEQLQPETSATLAECKETEPDQAETCEPSAGQPQAGEPADEKMDDGPAEEEEGDSDDLSGDVYSYTRRGKFTSELFKVELNNLPKFMNVSDLKKLFKNRAELRPQKMKVIRGSNGRAQYAFATFMNEAERAKAIDRLHNFQYKNRQLRVFQAKPAKDPLVLRKQQQVDQADQTPAVDYEQLSAEELNALICDKICPLWKLPYAEQLAQKEQTYRSFLDQLLAELNELYEKTEISAHDKPLVDWLKSIEQIPMDPIRFHEQTQGYRNKCEFSVGRDRVLGFRVDTYKNGSLKVIKPTGDCPIVNQVTLKLVDAFELYLKQSDLPPSDNETQTGHWKQLTVRSTSQGCLLIVHIDANGLSEERLTKERQSLAAWFASYPEVTSLYLNAGKGSTQLLHGQANISEVMGEKQLRFRISPYSFFQVNVRAAEICYDSIAEILGLDQNAILLDVCCGTGTIGLYLAGRVRQVLGIELNREAVADAAQNASDNEIENATFVDGNAEAKIGQLIQKAIKIGKDAQIERPQIVAVLDPPRAGLNKNLVKILRSCDYLNKFVYVSCEPKFARQNLIDFCRPVSKTYSGRPFRLSRTVPVDMFPHSLQCEMLLLYERDQPVSA